MKTLYEATTTVVGGRNGHLTSDDDRLDLALSVPKSMGGDDGEGTNPEQLFGGAYAACFGGAVRVIAAKKKIELSDDFSISATIGFCEDEDGAFLEATLDCYLPGVDLKTGESIIKNAHKICPFSKATQDNITVNLNLLLDE